MSTILRSSLAALTLLGIAGSAQAQGTAAASPRLAVKGTLSAKPGTRIVLSLNGGGDLTVVARANGTATFTQTPFTFTAPVGDGAPYSVTIKTPPPNTRCYVSAGTGTMSSAAPAVRVVCGIVWDLTTRTTDDKKTATFYETASGTIGGVGPDDGRYVAFMAMATGFGGTSGNIRQVFWRDRVSGITKLVSASPTGEEGNKDSTEPVISPDGKSVAFESAATNLGVADNNNQKDVYLWREATGKIERVSTTANGGESDAGGSQPSLSGDGSLVAFTSSATNLVPGMKTNTAVNVFLKDMRSGAITLVSVDENTGRFGSGSVPAISEDGARIAFHANPSLTRDDRNGLWDIYVWDATTKKLRRVSRTTTGEERQQGPESAARVVSPGISGDGRFVTFVTSAPNMASVPTTQQNIYAAHVDSGTVRLVSSTAAGAAGDGDSPAGYGEKVSISYDGTWVAFTSKAKNLGGSILMRNISTGATRILQSTGDRVGRPDVSRDGMFVIVGVGERLDTRFGSSGIFVTFR